MDENEKDYGHGWRHHGWPVLTVLKYVGIAIGGLALAVLLAFLFGYFVMLLWVSLGGCLVHAWFDFPFQVHSVLTLFLVLCAVLSCLSRRLAAVGS